MGRERDRALFWVGVLAGSIVTVALVCAVLVLAMDGGAWPHGRLCGGCYGG